VLCTAAVASDDSRMSGLIQLNRVPVSQYAVKFLYMQVRLYAVDAPEKTQACTNSRGESYMCGQVRQPQALLLQKRLDCCAVLCRLLSFLQCF
jgi:hypothetical protein